MMKLVVISVALTTLHFTSACFPPHPRTTPETATPGTTPLGLQTLPDECVCEGAGYYTPNSDCSGFYQYMTENDHTSGPLQNCGAGTAFNPDVCVCDHAGTFTCPSGCDNSLITAAVRAYQQFKAGDYDSIDMTAVKDYMTFRGLSVEELSSLLGLGTAGVQEINNRLEN